MKARRFYKGLLYPKRLKPQRVFRKDGFPKESGTVSKNTRKCIAYIKVCYILKDRNPGEYFVKMAFQRSLVQYRLAKLMCYSCFV